MQDVPHAIFFDADGTLYNSNRVHFLAYKFAAKHLYNISLDWKTFYENVLLTSKTGITLLHELGAQVDVQAFYALKETAYSQLVNTELQAMPGVVGFLSYCNANNIRCYIVTSSTLKTLEASLKAVNLSEYFQGYITREDSKEFPKPHPGPYKLGLELADVETQYALALEDTADGISSATQAGITCIGVKHSSNRIRDLAGAVQIIKSYDELIR